MNRIKEESGKGSVIFYPIKYTLQSRAPAAQPARRDSRLYSILVICAVFIAAKSHQMSKKLNQQEKPADQVVICDVLPGYPENLASALADLAGGQAQFHLFHQIERAAEFCAKNPADILLIAEEFPAEERRKIIASNVFLLTGENPKCSAQSRLLFRYQPADAIWKAITEYEKAAAGAVTFAAEERPSEHPADKEKGRPLKPQAEKERLPELPEDKEKGRPLKPQAEEKRQPGLSADGEKGRSSGFYSGEGSRQGLKESGNRQREPPQNVSVLRESPAIPVWPDGTKEPAFPAGSAGEEGSSSSAESTYRAGPPENARPDEALYRASPPEETLHEEALYRASPPEKTRQDEALYRSGPPKETLHEEALYRASPPEKTLQGKTYDRSRAPAQAPARTVRGLVAVYSPIHRIGKTRFALRLARQFAEKMPVLYLNLEGCSGQGGGLFPQNGPDLGDLLYYSRQENINFGLKLGTLTEQIDGVDYIRPMKNIQDFYAVKEREWLRLFRRISGKSIYEILILDLGDGTDGLFDILKACSRIYTPYTDEPTERAKLAQYEKTLKDIGYGEILARTVKKRMSKDEPD